jgi:hypothetical protein
MDEQLPSVPERRVLGVADEVWGGSSQTRANLGCIDLVDNGTERYRRQLGRCDVWSVVDGQQADRVGAILGARTRVQPRGLKPRVTEQLRGHYEVGVAAHERGRERMPEHVRGHMLLESGGGSDPGDHVVRAAGAQPAAAAVHKQSAVVAA